ncbi:MAG: Sorbitol dehydrogenase [Candidatus Moanabacter tarae]|uniref:Sorbitol dehydrogenase n=1 Tax=Candidatus Moanibacter tarae TaxID=2200854 RepID=A0A2Z4AK47_9BACT|nr:MAG: Sorbitol dehydrogenase [Candidatus Moanabacter tarae]|tara:strand:- start:33184 stop:34140 length:957 start_codon:yes stop_codon:yes gene_type:complete
MKQLEKLEGFGNVRMIEVADPKPGPTQVLVEVKRSLISRGSELFRRYILDEAVSPDIMGYSDAGEVIEIGDQVQSYSVGQRVEVTAPHAQFVVAEEKSWRLFPLPDQLSYEAATFLPLATSAVMWMRSTPIEPGETVVVLGQGLVGALCAQALRARTPGRIIAVDSHPLRCSVSKKLGVDVVIDLSEKDPITAVLELTEGKGADVVIECVGGDAGIKSFEQAQEMLASNGVIHLISKYQGAPLPLHGDNFMNKLLIAGIRIDQPREECLPQAAQMLIDGRLRTSELITHRLPWRQTPEAYHLLYQKPQEALGVILEWD